MCVRVFRRLINKKSVSRQLLLTTNGYMKIHRVAAPNGRICRLQTPAWDCASLLLRDGKVGDGQKSEASFHTGDVVRDTHRPVLRERFKLQPLLLEGKRKALDLKLALSAAFQAAHRLLLSSSHEAGRSRLLSSHRGQPCTGRAGRSSME